MSILRIRERFKNYFPAPISPKLCTEISIYIVGVVKKVGSGCFKIVHEKYRAKNADDQADTYQRKFDEVVKLYPELKPQTLRAVVHNALFN